MLVIDYFDNGNTVIFFGAIEGELNHYRQSKKGQSALRRTLTEGKLTQRRRHTRDLHAAAPPPALIPARSD
jgi:hypothetical protein